MTVIKPTDTEQSRENWRNKMCPKTFAREIVFGKNDNL